MDDNEKQAFKDFVAHQLAGNGWIIADKITFDNTNVVASKHYDTAVGQKTATALLTTHDDSNTRLHAEYLSEGRNILSTTSAVFPDGTKTGAAADLINDFNKIVNDVVADSYAAKLHQPSQPYN